ncbi:hypothetical protein ACFW17_26000 [Streptomyces sp. NPDC058961]|uniref:hypothetical protein n=1 Tax=unclassified Streptomyces TaxID=2593676 RepID=UPI0033249619
MSRIFEGLDSLDVTEHVRRWSSPDVGAVEGAVSQWMAAAQQFAVRLQGGWASLSDAEWRDAARAWAALLAAAERATGPQGNEWLQRDQYLRASLLDRMGPRPGLPLLDPALLLDRALDAMPMDRESAAALAPRWRELDRAEMLRLRMIKRLLAPLRLVEPLLADQARHGEYEAWRRVAERLP